MKLFRSAAIVQSVSLVMIGAVFSLTVMSGCTSSTVINSNPQGATLFVNGERVGTTPYTYSDAAIVASTREVRLELDGYETFRGKFQRTGEANVPAIIGGIFLLVPFLWVLNYEDQYTFELVPVE